MWFKALTWSALALPCAALRGAHLDAAGHERLIGWAGEKHSAQDDSCHFLEHTELAGDLVLWGGNNRVDSASHCCSMCNKFEPKDGQQKCNAWVWCGDKANCPQELYQTCWLKHQDLYESMSPGLMSEGPKCPWTSGVLPIYTKPPDAGALGMKVHYISYNQTGNGWLGGRTRERECGHPAVDGYAHVVPKCLENSKTAKEFDHSLDARMAQEVWIEYGASYDGLAVRWGIGNKHASVESCADACRRHKAGIGVGGPFARLPCNTFTYCPADVDICFEPDAHTHHGGDCWLKFTELPESIEVNQRFDNNFPGTERAGVSYSQRHKAPKHVQWIAGVLLPAGVVPSNGTWGPRAQW